MFEKLFVKPYEVRHRRLLLPHRARWLVAHNLAAHRRESRQLERPCAARPALPLSPLGHDSWPARSRAGPAARAVAVAERSSVETPITTPG